MNCHDSCGREEESYHPAYRAGNEEIHLNSSGRWLSDNAVLKTRDEIFNFGIWNGRTLYKSGELDNVIKEMKRMNIDIMGLSKYGG